MARKNSRKKQKQSQALPEKKLRKPGFEKEKQEEQNRQLPSLQLKTEHDIAMDFAVKVYKRFDKFIKSVVLFGSVAKEEAVAGSDIDIVIIIDDVSVRLDEEIVAWYREELEKLLRRTPYQQSLHVNTTKLSTWWEDLMRGDPTIINVIRYGEAMLDYGGFFEPLKRLLLEGKMRPSPEAIWTYFDRAPKTLHNSKWHMLQAALDLYWAAIDSAHAALMKLGDSPASPSHVADLLEERMVKTKMLDKRYPPIMRNLYALQKKIMYREIQEISATEYERHMKDATDFVKVMQDFINKKT